MLYIASWSAVTRQIARWTARVLGVGLILLFVVFAVSEGPPPLAWRSVALLMAMAGYVLAWFHDLLGGVMILTGTGTLYLINFVQNRRFPAVFPLMFTPGILLIASVILCRRTNKQAPR